MTNPPPVIECDAAREVEARQEDRVRRIVTAAERLYSCAEAIRAWAAAYPPGTMPRAVKDIVAAAEFYASQLEDE